MLEKMRPIIAEQLNVQESEIKENTKLKEDLGADSLDLFELVMALEEEFGVEIPSEDLESIVTVGDVITYLKNRGVTVGSVLLKVVGNPLHVALAVGGVAGSELSAHEVDAADVERVGTRRAVYVQDASSPLHVEQRRVEVMEVELHANAVLLRSATFGRDVVVAERGISVVVDLSVAWSTLPTLPV